MTVTFEMLEAEVRRLAAQKPDFIYPAGLAENQWGVEDRLCFYKPTETQPGCIFGQAFLNLGVDEMHLRENKAIEEVLDMLSMSDRGRDAGWATDVQEQQDMGRTWQEAIDYADGIWVND